MHGCVYALIIEDRDKAIHLITDFVITFYDLKASSSAGSSSSKTIDHFVGMGFPEEVVAKAIQENGMAAIYAY